MMYVILSSLIFACSVNLDAFFVSMSSGIQKSKISLLQNLFISLISFIGTILSILCGGLLVDILPSFLANCLGSVILIAMGIYYIGKFYLFSRTAAACTHPHASTEKGLSECSLSEIIFPKSLKCAFLLGIVLSMNNIGIGIGASIAGLALLPASFITLLISFLFIYVGNYLGIHAFHFSEEYGDLLSGLVLILLGVIQGIL